jgi:hypothetical protein
LPFASADFLLGVLIEAEAGGDVFLQNMYKLIKIFLAVFDLSNAGRWTVKHGDADVCIFITVC